MKWLMIATLILGFTSQAQQAQPQVGPALDEIVSLSNQSRLSDVVLKEFHFIKAVSGLPKAEYELAIQEIGRRYASEPKAMFHLLSKLQYQCRLDHQRTQQNEEKQKSTSAKWFQAVYESSEEFLSDLNFSGRFLPAILAAHNAQELPADQRGCPYDLLFHMASSPNEMSEQVRRAENEAVAQIANDVAATIPLAITAANVAQRVGFMTIEAGRVSQQLLIAGAVALTISQVIKSYGASKREDVLLKNWHKMKDQLSRGVLLSSDAADAQANEFYLSTMQLYAFYSYDLIAAQSADNSQQNRFNVRLAYDNSCRAAIDKRFLLEALKKNDVAQTMDVLRTSSCQTRYDFTRTLAQWNGNHGFKDMNEMRAVREKFITSTSADRQAIIEKEEQALRASWGNCSDPLYFLFTVADELNNIEKTNPNFFATRGQLLEVKNRIENKLFSTAQIRHDVLAAVPGSCAFARE